MFVQKFPSVLIFLHLSYFLCQLLFSVLWSELCGLVLLPLYSWSLRIFFCNSLITTVDYVMIEYHCFIIYIFFESSRLYHSCIQSWYGLVQYAFYCFFCIFLSYLFLFLMKFTKPLDHIILLVKNKFQSTLALSDFLYFNLSFCLHCINFKTYFFSFSPISCISNFLLFWGSFSNSYVFLFFLLYLDSVVLLLFLLFLFLFSLSLFLFFLFHIQFIPVFQSPCDFLFHFLHILSLLLQLCFPLILTFLLLLHHNCIIFYHLCCWLLRCLCSTSVDYMLHPVYLPLQSLYCFVSPNGVLTIKSVVLFSLHKILKSMFLYPIAFISIMQSLSHNFLKHLTSSGNNRYVFFFPSRLLSITTLVI